jgi:DNA-binding FadR family transcriptional regulator
MQLELAAVASVDDTTDFSSVHEAFEQFLEALTTHDVRTIVEADLAIHQAIVGLMGSERLNAYYAQLMNELRYFLLVLSIDHREYEDTTGLEQEHRTIVDALTLRDPAHTRQVLSGIIEENRDAVREILEKRTEV